MMIACVRWQDPTTHTGWFSARKVPGLKVSNILTVGILIHEDEEFIRVALDVTRKGGANGIAVIPKKSIIKMRKMKIPPGVAL